MTDSQVLQQRFLALLEHHRGLENAISVADMSKALGLGERGHRETRAIKRAVCDSGVAVGSSVGKISGYYLPVSEAEIEATLRQYCGRFYSLSVLIKQTRAKLSKPQNPQMGMF